LRDGFGREDKLSTKLTIAAQSVKFDGVDAERKSVVDEFRQHV
jgi:hypothetical protein